MKQNTIALIKLIFVVLLILAIGFLYFSYRRALSRQVVITENKEFYLDQFKKSHISETQAILTAKQLKNSNDSLLKSLNTFVGTIHEKDIRIKQLIGASIYLTNVIKKYDTGFKDTVLIATVKDSIIRDTVQMSFVRFTDNYLTAVYKEFAGQKELNYVYQDTLSVAIYKVGKWKFRNLFISRPVKIDAALSNKNARINNIRLIKLKNKWL